MKIYIVGSGGLGGYFGGLLAKSGQDVTFVARGLHYEAMKQDGLHVKSIGGNFSINPVKIIRTFSEITQPDLIIFSVKTYDTEEIAKELNTVINSSTIIVTFQNGATNDFIIKKIINSENIFPGVAYVITTKTQPGLIEQTGGLRKLIIGDRNNPENQQLKQVVKTMKNAGIDATLSDDISRDVWKKYMFIVAFSGMTAICRSPIGKILSDPVTRSVYELCVKEAISVAQASGANVADNAFDAIMATSTNTASGSKSSLLVDIENNRKNEIETLNGALVRLAKNKNIKIPINETIYGAIKLL